MGQTDKRFYWIKLRTDFFQEDSPIDFLMSQDNGAEYVVLYQMLCLKTANMNGQLSSQIGEIIIPYDIKKIVRDTKYFDIDTVTVALELFKKIGLIYEQSDGNLMIANYSRMVGSESASSEAMKKRKYREKIAEQKRLESNSNEDTYGDNEEDTHGDKMSDLEVDNLSDSKVDKMSDRDKRLDIRNIDNRYQDINKNKKEEEEKKPAKKIKNKVFLTEYHFSDSDIVQASFDEFLKMRMATKRGMTERAIQQLKAKLEKLSKDEYEQADILDQSTFKTWSDIYPLREDFVSIRERPKPVEPVAPPENDEPSEEWKRMFDECEY